MTRNLYGAIQVLRNAVGGGGVSFSGKKRYERVRFNVISVTRGWVGVKFPGKKHYVTLEWPQCVLALVWGKALAKVIVGFLRKILFSRVFFRGDFDRISLPEKNW